MWKPLTGKKLSIQIMSGGSWKEAEGIHYGGCRQNRRGKLYAYTTKQGRGSGTPRELKRRPGKFLLLARRRRHTQYGGGDSYLDKEGNSRTRRGGHLNLVRIRFSKTGLPEKVTRCVEKGKGTVESATKTPGDLASLGMKRENKKTI